MIGDMPADGWIDRYAPAATRPYLKLMRLDRPIGTWLLLFPCWWSITLASGTYHSAGPAVSSGEWLYLMILFGLGALVMRGAGCTVNDILDRDIDGKVARTAMRPLACGAITLRQALWFLVGELAVGLAILVQLNKESIVLGACALLLVGVYPMMKRLTYWPQAWLGITFNFGAILGWAAVRGTIEWPAVLLYIGGLFWTLGYDTIYAHQDKDDDVQLGVMSTALALGDRTVAFCWLFYGLTLSLIVATMALAGVHPLAYAVLALGGAQLAWQVITVKINDGPNCLARFKSNRLFGAIVLLAFAVDVWL
jgi:4-hydroxybenzoate polyprenyltransferase